MALDPHGNHRARRPHGARTPRTTALTDPPCQVTTWGPNTSDSPCQATACTRTPTGVEAPGRSGHPTRPDPTRPWGLPALAGGAVGGAAAAEQDLSQGCGAPGAGATGLAVGDQVVGVAAALAVDHAVVAEGGAFAGDGVGEDLTDGAVEGVGAAGAYPAGGGVDAGEPQGLVGVDVADAGDRALGAQVGLDRGAGGVQVAGEADRVELVRERF